MPGASQIESWFETRGFASPRVVEVDGITVEAYTFSLRQTVVPAGTRLVAQGMSRDSALSHLRDRVERLASPA